MANTMIKIKQGQQTVKMSTLIRKGVTKNQFKEMAREQGHEVAYSGHDKVMYIQGYSAWNV